MALVGLELTFVPDLKGRDKEYSSEAQAERAAKRLNRLLFDINCDLLPTYGAALVAKAERFRRTTAGNVKAALGQDNGEWEAWIVEVTNGGYPTSSDDWDSPVFVRLIQRAFDAAKSMRLLPRIRRRGIHHPTGGSHLVYGIPSIFADNTQFLSRLAAFERSWMIDQANRPYVRWLFSEWFDESLNSEAVILGKEASKHNDDSAYAQAIWRGSIRRRFSCDAKTPYSAYEVRLFDMCPTAKQIALQVRFLTKWIDYHRAMVHAGKTTSYTLTKRAFNKLRNEDYAWSVICDFFMEIGIMDIEAYRPFFDDQYVNRVRHGQMT